MPDFGVLEGLELMMADTEEKREQIRARYRRRRTVKLIFVVIAITGTILLLIMDTREIVTEATLNPDTQSAVERDEAKKIHERNRNR